MLNEETAEGVEGLSLTELIDRLHGVTEPEPISWMPQTTGWVVLAVFLAVVAALVTWRWWRRWQRNRYRREALVELDRIEAAASDNVPLKVAELLRRTALASFQRQSVASLIGDDWLAFLDRSYGGAVFSAGPGRLVATAPYGPTITEVEQKALIGAVRGWIRTHNAGV